MLMVFCFLNIQCNNNDDDDTPSCEKTTIVDANYYNNLSITNYPINNVEVVGNCLVIEFSSSGCDGESWEYNLIDSGSVAESSPEQRFLKFELINNEACLAVFNKTVSFDLIPLRVQGSNSIILNIEGYNLDVQYNYN